MILLTIETTYTTYYWLLISSNEEKRKRFPFSVTFLLFYFTKSLLGKKNRWKKLRSQICLNMKNNTIQTRSAAWNLPKQPIMQLFCKEKLLPNPSRKILLFDFPIQNSKSLNVPRLQHQGQSTHRSLKVKIRVLTLKNWHFHLQKSSKRPFTRLFQIFLQM